VRVKILIVDDDPNIREALTVGLSLRWKQTVVIGARDSDEGLQAFHKYDPDIVLLDVGMPGRDGFDVLRHLRRVSDVPVLMLTGRADEIDQVRGLELGADGYVTKPFSYLTLVARMKAALRRAELGRPAESQPTFTAGSLTINDSAQQVTLAGEPVKLTPVEYRLLGHLTRNAGRLMTHDALIDRVWGSEEDVTTDHLKVFICRLRAKLELPGGSRFIETERGRGYRFVRPAEVTSNGHASYPRLAAPVERRT
jgi:DNA-binding response OmpR family regulator